MNSTWAGLPFLQGKILDLPSSLLAESAYVFRHSQTVNEFFLYTKTSNMMLFTWVGLPFLQGEILDVPSSLLVESAYVFPHSRPTTSNTIHHYSKSTKDGRISVAYL